MENNHRINALRTVYKRRLLSTVITAAISLVIAVALLARPDLSEIMEICRRVMMRYDAFGIMETDWFRVEFGSWAQLPDEVRFGIIRG